MPAESPPANATAGHPPTGRPAAPSGFPGNVDTTPADDRGRSTECRIGSTPGSPDQPNSLPTPRHSTASNPDRGSTFRLRDRAGPRRAGPSTGQSARPWTEPGQNLDSYYGPAATYPQFPQLYPQPAVHPDAASIGPVRVELWITWRSRDVSIDSPAASRAKFGAPSGKAPPSSGSATCRHCGNEPSEVVRPDSPTGRGQPFRRPAGAVKPSHRRHTAAPPGLLVAEFFNLCTRRYDLRRDVHCDSPH